MKEITFHNAKQSDEIYFEWCVISCGWLLKATLTDGSVKLYIFKNLKQVEKFIENF